VPPSSLTTRTSLPGESIWAFGRDPNLTRLTDWDCVDRARASGCFEEVSDVCPREPALSSPSTTWHGRRTCIPRGDRSGTDSRAFFSVDSFRGIPFVRLLSHYFHPNRAIAADRTLGGMLERPSLP
jgi:hypothetical protein